jgi:hypothetical protein
LVHVKIASVENAFTARPPLAIALAVLRVYGMVMLPAVAHVVAVAGPEIVIVGTWVMPTAAVALLVKPHVPSTLTRLALKP